MKARWFVKNVGFGTPGLMAHIFDENGCRFFAYKKDALRFMRTCEEARVNVRLFDRKELEIRGKYLEGPDLK